MSLFKRLASLFAPSAKPPDASYWITVQCNRCGEKIRVRIDRRNDLSIDYGEDGSTTYFTRKVVIGENRCYQPIEVSLHFDANHKLTDREIVGGQFVDEP